MSITNSQFSNSLASTVGGGAVYIEMAEAQKVVVNNGTMTTYIV